MSEPAMQRPGRAGALRRTLCVTASLLALAGTLACGGGDAQDGPAEQRNGASVWDQMIWDQDDWG